MPRNLPTLLATTLLLACAALPLRAAPESATAADARWILAQIATPVPSRMRFVELRDSKLLKTPLWISGEYRRPDASTLVREVRSPYPETTTLRAGEATIEREGKATRRFSLSRVPELAGLQASFGALLAGDREQLQRHYKLHAEGTRRHWILRMAPKDAAVAAHVQAIVLHGRGDALRCIETLPVAGGLAQRTLLGDAARAAAKAHDGAAVAALCTGADNE